tara:strand:- start:1538 stop:1939 length:402 start_codon:yes stop_codon:yes gene_type:complete
VKGQDGHRFTHSQLLSTSSDSTSRPQHRSIQEVAHIRRQLGDAQQFLEGFIPFTEPLDPRLHERTRRFGQRMNGEVLERAVKLGHGGHERADILERDQLLETVLQHAGRAKRFLTQKPSQPEHRWLVDEPEKL